MPQEKPMRSWMLALLGLAAGAGAVYYLDPRHGPQRRADTQQRLQQWWDRLAAAREAVPEDDAALEPLSFAPEPLEQRESAGAGKVLPVLAMAAPVVLAVGAAMWKQRHDSGEWLH
jgi:hypothetical protein